MEYFVEKCCPICGKYYRDNSRNFSKMACSNKCRDEFINTFRDGIHDRNKLRLRLNILKSKGVEMSQDDLEKIENGLQNGTCEICGREVTGKALHIDHDHATKKYRGILCDKCNLLLGCANDDPVILSKAIEYLNRHGISESYFLEYTCFR